MLTGETPVEDLVNEALSRVTGLREGALVQPCFHEAGLGKSDGVGVDVIRFGQEWFCGADVCPDQVVRIFAMYERLEHL